MVFPHDDNVARFLREGWCDYREQAFLWRVLRAGDTFVDVGAHAGLYSALALSATAPNGKVVTVEPNPEIHPFLENNLRSGLETLRVTVHKVAAGAAAGQARFETESAGRSSFSRLAPSGNSQGAIPVDVARLDSLIEPEGDIACLKLDVEGAEPAALEGLDERAGAVRSMLVEVTELNLRAFGQTTETLFRALERRGFSVYRWTGADELTRVEYDGPIWYENLIATRDPQWICERLRTAGTERKRIAAEILSRGESSAALRSGELHMTRDAALKSLEDARAELSRALQRSLEAEYREQAALRQTDEAYALVGQANWHADEARKQAAAVYKTLEDARAELSRAVQKSLDAEYRAEAALRKADEAYALIGQANYNADEARKQADEARARAEAAERRAGADHEAVLAARSLLQSRVIAACTRILMPTAYRLLQSARRTNGPKS